MLQVEGQIDRSVGAGIQAQAGCSPLFVPQYGLTPRRRLEWPIAHIEGGATSPVHGSELAQLDGVQVEGAEYFLYKERSRKGSRQRKRGHEELAAALGEPAELGLSGTL